MNSIDEPPNEGKELEFWQDLCSDCGFQVEEIVLTHSIYSYKNLKEFQSKFKHKLFIIMIINLFLQYILLSYYFIFFYFLFYILYYIYIFNF